MSLATSAPPLAVCVPSTAQLFEPMVAADSLDGSTQRLNTCVRQAGSPRADASGAASACATDVRCPRRSMTSGPGTGGRGSGSPVAGLSQVDPASARKRNISSGSAARSCWLVCSKIA